VGGDQPLRVQPLQALPDRRTGDLEPLGDLDLGERLARAQVAADDLGAEPFVHLVGATAHDVHGAPAVDKLHTA